MREELASTTIHCIINYNNGVYVIMFKNEKIKKFFTIIFVSILIIIPISLCFSKSIWVDEGFSLRWSMWPFPAFIERIKLDVCPLYLCMLRIVLTVTGNSLLAAKLFSVLAVFLLFIIGAFFVKREFGYRAMIFYCLFVLFTPMMLTKSVEVRTYTWSFFFVSYSCVQMYYLLRPSCTRKNWILFTLSSLAAAYTHYFAVLTLVIVYSGIFIFYLFKRDFKKLMAWLLCAICTIVLYLPWVPIILRQMKSETTSWIPAATSRLGIMRDMFRSDIPRLENIYILLLVIFALVGFILWCRLRTVELYWSLVCMSAVWIILIFGLLFEKMMRPVLVAKYLMIPLYVTILGMCCICKYMPKYLLCIPMLLFVITGLRVYPKVYAAEYDTMAEETLQFADEHFREGDIILYDYGDLCSVIPYYFPETVEIYIEEYDMYSANFDYIWYFAAKNKMDMEELQEYNIQYIDYGVYGFDLEFTIYYLYHVEE